MLCLWCKQISRFTWFSHSHPTSSLLLSLKYCFQVIQSDVHTYIYQSQQKTMDYGCVECVTNATYCSTLHYHYCPQCRQYSVMTIDSWELVSGDLEIYLPTTAPTHAKVMCTEVLLDCVPLPAGAEEDTMHAMASDSGCNHLGKIGNYTKICMLKFSEILDVLWCRPHAHGLQNNEVIKTLYTCFHVQSSITS